MAFGDAAVIALVEGPFSVAVTRGAGTTRGILSETDSVADFGGFTPATQMMDTEALDVGERRLFLFCYAGRFDSGQPLHGLAQDEAITANGRDVVVRRHGPIDDGRVIRIVLAEAS